MTTIAQDRLIAIEQEIAALRKEANGLRNQASKGRSGDYVLATPSGTQRLSDFFGDKPDLIVIHNMGRSCDYCSLWADGINGFTDQFLTRAGLVLCSPDPIDRLSETAKSRGWRMPLASSNGTSFFKDFGFESPEGGPLPGVSTFRKEPDGSITHLQSAEFGPGDDYCSIWHFFSLLDTDNSWEPIPFNAEAGR